MTPAEAEAAHGYIDASRAASTRRAYAADWRRTGASCRARDAPALPAPPELVALYLSVLAGRGLAPPLGRPGARRHRPRAPPRRPDVAAPGPERRTVQRLLWSIERHSLAALRDRALIAFGMALAARRSELVALDVADLAWEEEGLRVTIRRSKTDQEAEGAVVAVPEGRRLAPLVHLRAWLQAACITEGAVFRPLWKGGRGRDARLSGHAVARIIQARAAAAGLDPARFAGHSLRAGFVTSAARAGADVWKIQQVSRHRSL